MRLYAVILCLAIHASIQTSAQTPADSCGMVASTDSAATYVVDNTLATDSITTPAPQKKTTSPLSCAVKSSIGISGPSGMNFTKVSS